MNGRAFPAKNKPKPALRQIDGGFDSRKASSRASDVFDLSKVVEVIGRNINGPVLLKRHVNRAQEIGRYDSAPMMPPFWPGIGKQEIERFH